MASVDLEYIDRVNQKKQKVVQKIQRKLSGSTTLEILTTYPNSIMGGFFPALPVRVKDGVDRSEGLKEIRTLLGRNPFLKAPYIFAVPTPHYHQLRHMWDLDYRAALIDETSTLPPLEEKRVPSLPVTEEQLERIIMVPIEPQFSIKTIYRTLFAR